MDITKQNFKVFLIAGEASGDLLGADLAKQLFQMQPDIQLLGLGGKQMRQAGVEIVFDNELMNIVGWWEVIKNLKVIRQAMLTIKKQLKINRPDLIILIDYPGFNLRIAKIAKRLGIKVLYYVSPQIWAWKYQRIHTIRECVDHMAVLFQFEEAIYRREKVPVTFVGHPLTALVKASDSKEAVYQRYHLNPAQPIIALFPGSRMQELRRMMPEIISAIQKIKERSPDAQFVLPLAPTLKQQVLLTYFNDQKILIIKNDTYNILSVCNAAIVKSGTGTLEVALSQVPLMIIYKGSYINYWIARLLVKVKQIGLCNIVAQKTIAREFIQHQVTPETIATETLRLLNDANYRQNMLNQLAELKQNFGDRNTSSQVAKIAINLLKPVSSC
ncbi:MAG: lipid-A-disaccharide synthase [Proteobacteria bacterium]|nr:lipid-A-disaccharide synthase [Pseudomonadota bacterium]